MKLKEQEAEDAMQKGLQDGYDGKHMSHRYKNNKEYMKGYEEGKKQKEKESGEDYMPIQKTDLTVASLEEMIKEVMQEYGYSPLGRRRVTRKEKERKKWNAEVNKAVKAMGKSIEGSDWTGIMTTYYGKYKDNPELAAKKFYDLRFKEEPMEEASTSASGAAGGYSKKKKVYQEE